MEEIVHQDASTKKRVFALLINYFLLVVGNVIFYFILVSQVANALPLMKELSNSFYESYTTTNQIIEDSKLDSITSSNYIKMSVKTTLGEKYYLTTEYDLLASLNKTNDPIYYYLNEYKIKSNNLDFEYNNRKAELEQEFQDKEFDIEYKYKKKIKSLEKENNRLYKIIDKFYETVEKFIVWICHKFGIGESKELIKDFQKETNTFIDPVKQLENEEMEKELDLER